MAGYFSIQACTITVINCTNQWNFSLFGGGPSHSSWMYKHWSQERSRAIAKKMYIIVGSVSETVVSFMGMASYLSWLHCWVSEDMSGCWGCRAFFGVVLEDLRWREAGLVRSYSSCLLGVFSRVNWPLWLALVLSGRQLGGVIGERIRK